MATHGSTRVRRPARSPARREPLYRGIHDKPRDLLIFSCNPQRCSLPGLDDEVHAVQKTFPRKADVRHVRNLDPKELQKEMLSRPPRAFMFAGHTNAQVDGERTLAFCTGSSRELVAVQPETLAHLLGEFSPARGGPLRLVFLNGCESEALGRAVLDAGVPHVVCWSTIVENKAAAAFSEGFFSAWAEHGCDCAKAFEQAKLAVTLIPRQGVVSGSLPGFVPKYELRDPRQGATAPPLVSTPSGRQAAGIPLHLTSEPMAPPAAAASPPPAGWLGAAGALATRGAARLHRAATSSLEQLLDAAECRAKRQIGADLLTQTAPQTLEALMLQAGEEIVVDVTVGFFRTVAWPTRVLSARRVRWAALPSVDPVAYAKETDGNVRFVLTPKGLLLYDEDFGLYYPWHRTAAAAPRGPGEPAEGDAAAPPGGSRLVRLAARGLLLLVAVGAVLAACAACRLLLAHLLMPLLTHVLMPLLGRPSLLLAAACAALPAYIAVRVAIRLVTEDDADEEEEE